MNGPATNAPRRHSATGEQLRIDVIPECYGIWRVDAGDKLHDRYVDKHKAIQEAHRLAMNTQPSQLTVYGPQGQRESSRAYPPGD